MKSTYQLIGVFWDHKPISNRAYTMVASDNGALDYCSEPCLFDCLCKKRFIYLSTLLNIESSEEASAIIGLLKGTDVLEVRIDYRPKVSNITHDAFYQLRMKQALAFLEISLPHTLITVTESNVYQGNENKLTDFLSLIDSFISYLESRGVPFNSNGYPVLSKNAYLKRIPDNLVTYKSRKSSFVTNKATTALCFFMSDKHILVRMRNLYKELPLYKQYLGVVVPDITVTSDMELEWQREIMLINQLFGAVLAVNRIRLIANSRNGSRETISSLNAIPAGVIFAVGTLGCELIHSEIDTTFLQKMLRLRPSSVLIYGRKDPMLESQLSRFGIPYKRFNDMHTRYKKRKAA